MVKQDLRLMKRRVNPGLGVSACSTAQRTLQGDGTLPRLRKGQLEGVAKGDVLAQNRVIYQLFGVAASRQLTTLFSHPHEFLQHNLFISRTLVRLLTSSEDVRVAKSMVAALNLCTAARCCSVRPQPASKTAQQATTMSREERPRDR
jgi:hypothetical protein